MDYKKIAIISTVAAILAGGAVFGAFAWRARQLEQPAVIPPEQPLLEPNGTATGTGAVPAGTPIGGDSPTTVDPAAEPWVCPMDDLAEDCDGDGLTNGDEAKWKTDPAKRDTDGDQLTDGSEVHTHVSDPLDPTSLDPDRSDLDVVNERATRQ